MNISFVVNLEHMWFILCKHLNLLIKLKGLK